MTSGPFAAVFTSFDLVDLEGTGELSTIPMASTVLLAGDFFCFFKIIGHSLSLPGWPATCSAVLRGAALFAAMWFYAQRPTGWGTLCKVP